MQIEDPTTTRLFEEMKRSGIIRIDDVLSAERSAELSQFVSQELKASIDAVTKKQVLAKERFSTSLANGNRWDFKLPMNDLLKRTLMDVLSSKVGDVLGLLATENAEVTCDL